MKKLAAFSVVLLCVQGSACANSGSLAVAFAGLDDAMLLASGDRAVPLVVDPGEAGVLEIAAAALADDVNLVCGARPSVLRTPELPEGDCVVIGMAGVSRLLNALVRDGGLSVDDITGKWEAFKIELVELSAGRKILVIAGSDRRGTAFGVFELSGMLGVSPWVWWADVEPQKRDAIYVTSGSSIVQSPSVRYRGIFLNDEDWGLQPWAAKTYERDPADIGPKTYAEIFELLLRLKANHCWPAMHSCTKAFNHYAENRVVADRYAIVMGSAHCEPLLFNNASEWDSEQMGPWRYDTNREGICRVLDRRVSENGRFENIYTVGLRGIHDTGMQGGLSLAEQVGLLEKVFADQRTILTTHIDRPIAEIPQVFIPYKEVMALYDNGLRVPDDVTLMWVDDNHGYVRRLSSPAEQERSGRAGVYYHLSYWGDPVDFLWLGSSVSAVTAYEMHKAYAYGADRVWVFNVGDIKPIEKEMTFALEMAWDVDRWTPWNAHEFNADWSGRTFGAEFAAEIGEILDVYYRLAADARPEHILSVAFSERQIDERLAGYRRLADRVEKLKDTMPERLSDAYFQLVYYPVVCAKLLNEKVFLARRSREVAANDASRAAEYMEAAQQAFDRIGELTRIYNEDIAAGKWRHMMHWNPNNREVFREPQRLASSRSRASSRRSPTDPIVSISAVSYVAKQERPDMPLRVLPGYKDGGITIADFAAAPLADEQIAEAPWVEYEADLPAGDCTVAVRCMPTHRVHAGRGVRIAVAVGNDAPAVRDLHAAEWTDPWRANVLRHYSVAEVACSKDQPGKTKVRVFLMEPGVVLDRVNIYAE